MWEFNAFFSNIKSSFNTNWHDKIELFLRSIERIIFFSSSLLRTSIYLANTSLQLFEFHPQSLKSYNRFSSCFKPIVNLLNSFFKDT